MSIDFSEIIKKVAFEISSDNLKHLNADKKAIKGC